MTPKQLKHDRMRQRLSDCVFAGYVIGMVAVLTLMVIARISS